MLEKVSPQLSAIVRHSLFCLGRVIEEREGKAAFKYVENLRLATRSLRNKSFDHISKELAKEYNKIRKLDKQQTEIITKSFSHALELINTAEIAFRTHRISTYENSIKFSKPTRITLVLTAHPTEARSQELIAIYKEIQSLMIEFLNFERLSFPFQEIQYHLHRVWNLSIAPSEKPSVEDEATNVMQHSLNPVSLDTISKITCHTEHQVQMRTWVGGDKDGHPGVSGPQTQKSLAISRKMIIDVIKKDLHAFFNECVINSACPTAIKRETKSVLTSLYSLRNLKAGDGKRLKAWKESFYRLSKNAKKAFKATPPAILKVEDCLERFPAIVLPLEMREDAGVLEEISTKKIKKQDRFQIVKMLQKIYEISDSTNSKDYLKGFVISHCASVEDILNAHALIKTHLKTESINIVPLFETKKDIENSHKTISTLFANKRFLDIVRTKWDNTFEIMVGYSDSAKEVGVLSSRLLISKALPKVTKVCKTHSVRPIFFHGSGGSISRGGGSTSEQCAWWPKEARERFKMTVQGEMVQRTFASKSVLKQNLTKMLSQNQGAAPKKHKFSKTFETFAATQESTYKDLVSNPEFLDLITKATPYEYLSHLKLGSRPAKRGKLTGVNSLRAIPWVLCWTQTRTLIPTWWGIGKAWSACSDEEKNELSKEFKDSALFSSFVKQLGFSLQKVELGIWKLYLSTLTPKSGYAEELFKDFKKEYKNSVDFVNHMSGSEDLLWFRPWLGASIKIRSPMIFPLHLVQLKALETKDMNLMRQSVTGIASGMLTTG